MAQWLWDWGTPVFLTMTLAGILLGIFPPKTPDASADGAKDYRKQIQNNLGIALLTSSMLVLVFLSLPERVRHFITSSLDIHCS
jgi:hypothetical protein